MMRAADMLKYVDLRLGFPKLLNEWKLLLSPQYFLNDLSAGLTVAFVAIPLSLAIALASEVPPATGLITAIIAGIVCALFGGTRLAVSGPAAAMCVLLADIVEKFGIESLALICLVAGLMQLISGIFGLGKLARYVPLPVIAGFTAGIGVIILIGQLPRAFGLAPPAESQVFDVFNHLKQYIHEINGACLLLVAITILIIRGLPKLLPKVPSILVAVIAATSIVYFFELKDVPLIGNIPRTLPNPHFPIWPQISTYDIIFNAFTIYLLASLETLLSSSAIDKLTNQKKHDSNQELIGQGLGNIVVAFFSGMPVTGVIARSATNVRAGAKTRRASIIHSIIILLTVFAIAPIIAHIPIAALAGVLFSVAFSMINYREFYGFWHTSRAEALIYGITFLTIVFVDLIAGVQAGIIAACIIILLKAARTQLVIFANAQDDVTRLSLTGSLTFLSSGKIGELEQSVKNVKPQQTILLDLTNITDIDTSGATAIIELYNLCHENRINFYIKGLARRFENIFKGCGGSILIDHCYLVSEHELRKKEEQIAPKSSRGRLIHGVHRFYEERKYNDKRLFEYISKKQDPHTLFIACSDSRIIPSLITSSDPGELFIIRNVGNFVPPYNPNRLHGEAAALEFALSQFDINDIVVCGHANCGAIQACRSHVDSDSPRLKEWIEMIKAQLDLDEALPLNEIAKQNVLNQIENIKLYPIVQEKMTNGSLNLHAWYFDFNQSMVYEWDHQNSDFMSLITESQLA